MVEVDDWSKARSNLTPQNQARMLRVGVGLFAVGLVASVVLVETGLPVGLRALLFVPFLLASNTIGMALTGTCPYRAMMGLRDTEEGNQPVGDKRERAFFAARGRRLVGGAMALAGFLTVLFVLA